MWKSSVTIMAVSVSIALSFNSFALGYIIDPGPKVIATRGAIWPQPQNQTIVQDYYTITPNRFRFQVIENDCDLLEEAFARYWAIIDGIGKLIWKSNKRQDEMLPVNTNQPRNNSKRMDGKWLGNLEVLSLIVKTPCKDDEWPKLHSPEDYVINIDGKGARLTSMTVWGALWGLESFVQSIYVNSTNLLINLTTIVDYPRFKHRGLLLDTSRHYLSVSTILNALNAMSFNKMNVFHWHIVDDQSFPYVSRTFPELSDKGAYHSQRFVYRPHDVRKVIEHARKRGIRVVPEFDTPGHTRSWGVGIPDLLTPCGGNYRGKLGPIDPSRAFVYDFMRDFYAEIVDVFPDDYLHLGGDEVGFECWQSNAEINQFMARLNMTAGDYKALESYYLDRLVKIIDQLPPSPPSPLPYSKNSGEMNQEKKKSLIVWQEVYQNGVRLPAKNVTVVQVWMDDDYWSVMNATTGDGYPTLLSSCWYLDHLKTGGDWTSLYDCEPYSFNGTDEQLRLVIGGEACMWGESVDDTNVESRVWPRASATAEKLWSSVESTGHRDATTASRLEEHACRLNGRGVRAQPPNGPGYCLTLVNS